jgi:anti-sigma-K factor RskA
MEEIPRSAALMTALLKNIPGLMDQAKTNPAVLDKIEQEVTKHLPTPAFIGDKMIYRTVVIALAGVALLAVIGALMLAIWKETVPDMVTALGSAAIGAMAGLLAPSPTVRS